MKGILTVVHNIEREENTIKCRITVDYESPEYQLAEEAMTLYAIQNGIATFVGNIEQYSYYMELCDYNKKEIRRYHRNFYRRDFI